MHSIRAHKVIALIISFFYLTGFSHRRDKPTTRELTIKFFYSIYYLLFLLSLAVGAITNERIEKTVLLTEISIGSAVLAIKLWLLIWKQNEIFDLLNRVSVFSIQNDDDYNNFNDKLRGFTKFVIAFVIAIAVTDALGTIALPFLVSEKSLIFEIGFPLDYKNNETAFWLATFFLFTEVIFTFTAITFSTIIWYLLYVCSLRYEVLGSALKNMGRSGEKRKITEQQKRNSFREDLKASIDLHLHVKELADGLVSSFSTLFFVQFGTSGLCICGSIYCVAFDIGNNLLERPANVVVLFYFIVEIFMITYFGNEIKLSSNRLSYSLFESDWYDQPQSTKKCIIIFGEYLKEPPEIRLGKLYPLTLETFTRILKSAYSMFNILKNSQQ